jgi:POT family proton-dependent oligopeptide transporter
MMANRILAGSRKSGASAGLDVLHGPRMCSSPWTRIRPFDAWHRNLIPKLVCRQSKSAPRLVRRLVYLTPLFGGWLADHVLGQRRTVILGAALMAVGHFMMAFEPLFLLVLVTLILGNGAFKPNMSTQVRGLYAPGDHRRDRAYSIFYVGINVGAFLAPLVCGTLGEELGWHYGFAAAGVGMTIALAAYLYASPMLPPDEMHKAKAAGLDKKPLDRNECRAVLALITLFLPTTMFWATYEQQGNTIALWADEHTTAPSISLFGTARSR